MKEIGDTMGYDKRDTMGYDKRMVSRAVENVTNALLTKKTNF